MSNLDFVYTGPETLAGRYGAIPDRENEYLGRSDAGVVLLRQIWQRELAALAAGEQLKKWTRPANLVATTAMAER
jgi:hypothetical protein